MNEGEQHATVMGRKILKTISALEEVEQFEQIDTDIQIKAFLSDTRELLNQMIRIVRPGFPVPWPAFRSLPNLILDTRTPWVLRSAISFDWFRFRLMLNTQISQRWKSSPT